MVVVQLDASTSRPADGSQLDEIVVLDDVLSSDECSALLAKADRAGFARSEHKGKADSEFRRSGRALLSDIELARDIFGRIRHALPPAVRPESRALSKLSAAFLRIEPAWGPAAGLWEELRVLQYQDESEHFKPHRDNRATVGQSTEFPDASSFYSLLLYLCDVPGTEDHPAEQHRGGGSAPGVTRFYCQPPGSDPFDEGHVSSCVVAEVVPRRGRAVLFPHRILHEGAAVGSGQTKLVMRGDVLFEPPPAGGAAADRDADSEDEEADECGRRRRKW